MSSSYTSSLRLVLPVQGELNNTWGDVVNAGLTNLTDSAIAGTATVSIADANTTLTSNNGAADQAREMFLSLTGSLTAGRSVICPSASKLYFATNGTTGGFATTLKTAGGTGVAIPAGRIMALYCDGTNVKDAVSYVSELQTPSLYSSGGATVVGGIAGASLSLSGGAVVTGAVTAGTLITAGAVSASTASVSGALSAGSLGVSGAITGSAGMTIDGTTFVVDATNNRVGIGTGAPAATLDVVGSANVSGVAALGAGSTGVTPSTGDRSTKLATTQMFINEFGASLAGSGYQKLPNGLILQWGVDPGGAGDHAITFPIPFTGSLFNVQATMEYTGSTTSQILSCAVGTYSLSSFYVYPRYGNNGAPFGVATQPILWFAIGV